MQVSFSIQYLGDNFYRNYAGGSLCLESLLVITSLGGQFGINYLSVFVEILEKGG